MSKLTIQLYIYDVFGQTADPDISRPIYTNKTIITSIISMTGKTPSNKK